MHKGLYKLGILLFILMLYAIAMTCIANDEMSLNLTTTYCVDDTKYQANFDESRSELAIFTWYLIGLINNGEVSLDNVVLSATLPRGMMFKNSSYSGASGFVEIGDSTVGILELESQEPEKFDGNIETKLTWKIGTLQRGQQIYIRIGAFKRPDATSDSSNLKTEVIGRAPDNTIVRKSRSNADLEEESVCNLLSGKPVTLPEGPNLE